MFATTPDGRRLRLYATGPSPARDLAVFEAGLGVGGASWRPVLDRLGPGVTGVAYDRAGYGDSDPARDGRDLPALANDLAAVVAAVVAAVPHRRLVLVGHSWGGPIVRAWAHAHRVAASGLAGLVLVDPSDERADLYFSRASAVATGLENALAVPLARVRLLGPLLRGAFTDLPEPLRGEVAAASGTVPAARAIVAENRQVAPELAGLRRRPLDLGGLPVRIVSGGRSTRLDRRPRADLVAAHRASAAALGGEHVLAARSGHLVPFSEPGLVADQVRALFAAAG